jgi:hypothetical protein
MKVAFPKLLLLKGAFNCLLEEGEQEYTIDVCKTKFK